MEYSVCHERGTKKKSDSPTGIEPMTSRTLVGRFFNPDVLIFDPRWAMHEVKTFLTTSALTSSNHSDK